MSAFSEISSLLSFTSTEPVEALVESLLTCIEARDSTLRRHSERVARYSDHIALAFDLDTESRQQLVLGALLHDIGNIGIPDSILLKPTGLTTWEFNEMRLHPILGEQICRPLAALAPALPLVRSHHEKLDGSGYPDGLKGDEIPLIVRVLSVTDVYDTLRCERAYRDAFTHAQALEILEGEAERGWWDSEIISRLANVTAPESDFVPV